MAGLLGLVACAPQVAIDESADGTGTASTSGTTQGPGTLADTSAAPTSDDNDDAADDWHDLPPEEPRTAELDVLFVIDNSGTMADAQLALSEAMSSFVDDLAGRGEPRSVHVMVTTTDMGNPLCTPFKQPGYTPTYGGPVSTGCNERILDFVGLGSNPLQREDVCTSQCPVDVEPTDPFLAFDTGTGATNAVSFGDETGLELAQAALACMLPQGINGCGYESPLEAMIQALNPDAAWNSGDAAFLRDGADLVIVMASDEADCSIMNGAVMEDPAFQNANPDTGNLQATSALCWNAGTTCDGPDADGVYSSCAASEEPLLPTSRYTALLGHMVEQGKQVSMVVLSGVPSGGLGELVYRDWQDGDLFPAEVESGKSAADLQFELGIGPGCVGETTATGGLRGLPSPRVFEVCDALGDGCCINSICDGYGAAVGCLKELANRPGAGFGHNESG